MLLAKCDLIGIKLNCELADSIMFFFVGNFYTRSDIFW